MTQEQSGDAAVQRYWKEFWRCRAVVIRELRTEQGLTQRELAKRAEVSLVWLQKIEENRLPRGYRMAKEIQVISALGFGIYEIHKFYKRVEEMAEKTVGPPPWPTRRGNQGGTAD
jgi:DNA-binding XRE family transcriptional regulator